MEKKIYQVVVKFNATNRISVYDFESYSNYIKTIEVLRNYDECIIITTNVCFKNA